MATQVDIGMLISHDEKIRRGKPCISGTGVTVQRVVSWYKLGLTPEEISGKIGHISLAQVHAALAYYHANKEEIEKSIAEDKAAGDEAKQEFEHLIRTK
jgi:uncharacterized protein (DUF433 family)